LLQILSFSSSSKSFFLFFSLLLMCNVHCKKNPLSFLFTLNYGFCCQMTPVELLSVLIEACHVFIKKFLIFFPPFFSFFPISNLFLFSSNFQPSQLKWRMITCHSIGQFKWCKTKQRSTRGRFLRSTRSPQGTRHVWLFHCARWFPCWL